MRVSGFQNVPGAPGNLQAGINMSGFDINKRPGTLGGRAGEQLKGGPSPLGNAGFFEGQNINTFQTPFSLPNGFINKYIS
jgi:hypothetical protein